MDRNPVNFDRNASYGLLPEVLEGLKGLFGLGLNPSSIHSGGRAARRLVEDARDSLSELLRLKGGERIIFTSGATEANNAVVYSALESPRLFEGQGIEFVCSAYEHPSVIEPVKKMERLGRSAVLISRSGAELCAEDFLSSVGPKTRLVSLMFINNETGEIFPTREIFGGLRRKAPSAIFHSDAVQALGKIDFAFEDIGADAATISGHKIGALLGIGALILKSGAEYSPQLSGGGQEQKERAGTENVLGIASFGLAARAMSGKAAKRAQILGELKSLVEGVITEGFPAAVIVNRDLVSAPNTLSVRFPGVRGDDLVVAADLEGVLISSGAACSSGKQLPSHVLLAMNIPANEARETVRISLGAEEDRAEVQSAARTIVEAAKKLYARRADV